MSDDYYTSGVSPMEMRHYFTVCFSCFR